MIPARINTSNIRHAIARNRPCNTVPQEVGVLFSTASVNLTNTRLINGTEEIPRNVINISANNLYCTLAVPSANMETKSADGRLYSEIGVESDITYIIALILKVNSNLKHR
jgi:hypothetical protein